MELSKLYLYLARRDKSSVRVLAILQGESKTMRIHNLSDLSLPTDMHEAISQEVDANRLLWEVWIEPAESFNVLKAALTKRGYKSLPTTSKAIMPIKGDTVNLASMKDMKKKGMLQKGG
jgi:hypothetical protein